MKNLVIVMLAVGCLMAIPAYGAQYICDFEAGADGWDEWYQDANNFREWRATGGVDDSGYFYSSRNNTQGAIMTGDYQANGGNVNFFGDWEAKYGTDIHIQWDLKDFDGTKSLLTPVYPHIELRFTEGLGGMWKGPSLIAPSLDPLTGEEYPDLLDMEWHQFNLRLNPNWTDVEATAAGWTLLGGGSWADLMDAVVEFKFFANGSIFTGGKLNQFGVDNAAIGSWPISAEDILGDFNEDGDVDAFDFADWQANYPTASGATRAMGDSNGDGDVDAFDFADWQANYPYPPPPEPAPEPTTIVLLSLASLVLLCSKGRKT